MGKRMTGSTRLSGFKRFLIFLVSSSLLAGLGILPASADGPVDVQLGTPAVSAIQGSNLGDIDITFQAGSPSLAGQLYTVTVTDPQLAIIYQSTDVSDIGFDPAFTVSGLALDQELTVTVTAQAWISADGTSNYLAATSTPVTVQAKGSISGFQTPTWTDQTLAYFVGGKTYVDALRVQSDASITYAITSGALPDGISIDASDGTISGVPTTPGASYTFEVTAQTIPSNLILTFTGTVRTLRMCEDYSNASYASNILLNSDGTPIGCDFENQPADLRPQGWLNTFNQYFGESSNNPVVFSPRLGWACDDCWVGGTGDSRDGPGIPIGFDVNFFGTTYNDVFVNSNGSITFGRGSWNYSQPLNEVLSGSPGVAPYAVDLANWDVNYADQAWGPGSARHADFFYWGRTTYAGKQAFVVTWMNSQIYPANSVKDFNTFQVIIVDNGAGDADYIINYGSLQDGKNNSGYNCNGPDTCQLAAGFGSNNGTTTLYASLQDQTGYLYNGAITSTTVDGGSNSLATSSLNSDVPGQFIYHMVSGYVPEVATVPGAPLDLTALNSNDAVTATWNPPISVGGAPITGYVLRYRLAGSTDTYTQVQTSALTSTISNLAAGNYAFQIAAVNEIGQGPFSRSLLVSVAGPLYADLTAYLEALSYAESLTSSNFTVDSWLNLTLALSHTVTRENSQADVDLLTSEINTALSGLMVSSAPVLAVNYTDYNQAVAFAGTLQAADFTTATWQALTQELAVDISGASDQATVDAQTALINAALNALTRAGAGDLLQMSVLTLYNAAVSQAHAHRESGYTSASWLGLQTELTVPISRNNSQSEVDAQTARITTAISNLVSVADLTAYNLAVADAAQYSATTTTSSTWADLQTALAVTVDSLSSQIDVDSATAAINAAIAALVFTANMTAYNEAVAQAHGRTESNYTAGTWANLVAAVAIPVDPLTDAQIYVDIATTNITSALAALVALVPLVTVTVLSGDHGSTSHTGASQVAQGADFSFTVTANSGWEIDHVDNASQNLDGSYSVLNVLSDTTVTVYYVAAAAPVTYIVDVKPGDHGTTTRNGENSVVSGSNLSFTITPNTGWEVASVDGATLVSPNTYSVSNVTGNLVINITYAAVSLATSHIVTVIQGNHGVSNPNGSQVVQNGASLSFTVSPDSGWLVLAVENAVRNSDGSYSVGNVTSDLTVTVTYTRAVEAVSYVPPTIEGLKIVGQLLVGQTLVAEVTGVNGYPSPTLTYAWYCNTSPIAEATAASYTLTSAEAGCSISVTVVATNGANLKSSSTQKASGTVPRLEQVSTFVWQFDKTSAALKGKSLISLQRLSEFLLAKDALRIRIVSYASSLKSVAKAMTLANERARYLAAFLKSHNVFAKFAVVGLASTKLNKATLTATWEK